jgi:hypothetical protein
LNYAIPGKLLEERLEYNKQQSQKYRDQHKQLLTTKFKCICGGKYSHANKHHHIRNNKHQNYIKIKEIILNHQTIISNIDKFILDTNKFIESKK